MTNEEMMIMLREYFDQDVEKLRKRGITITNVEEVWENRKVRNQFRDKVKYYSSDESYQSFIDRRLSEVNGFARVIGIPEISFSVIGKIMKLPDSLTGEEFVKLAPKRRDTWFDLSIACSKLEKKVEEQYLQVKFDEAVKEAKDKKAKAILFRKKSWKGFTYPDIQKRFKKSLEEIKAGTYTGGNLYCQECIGASALVILVEEDMTRSKEYFMKPGNGGCLIVSGKPLYWEFIL